MLILGLLLVVVSAAAGVLLVSYNHAGGPEQTVVLFGRDLVSVNALEAFIAGIVVALVFCLGMWMVVSSGRRARLARADYRAARREAKAAARERDELAGQLERERAANEAAATTTTVPAARTTTVDETGVRRDTDANHANDANDTVRRDTETRRDTGAHRLGRHFRRRREDAVVNERTTNG